MLTKLSLIKPTTDVAYTIFLGQFEIVNSQASDSVITVCPGEEYATLVQRTGNGKKGASFMYEKFSDCARELGGAENV